MFRYNQKATPILWNSTLVLDGDDPKPFAVCRRGNPEDCQEGLLDYDYGALFDPEYRKCSILTREFLDETSARSYDVSLTPIYTRKLQLFWVQLSIQKEKKAKPHIF